MKTIPWGRVSLILWWRMHIQHFYKSAKCTILGFAWLWLGSIVLFLDLLGFLWSLSGFCLHDIDNDLGMFTKWYFKIFRNLVWEVFEQKILINNLRLPEGYLTTHYIWQNKKMLMESQKFGRLYSVAVNSISSSVSSSSRPWISERRFWRPSSSSSSSSSGETSLF